MKSLSSYRSSKPLAKARACVILIVSSDQRSSVSGWAEAESLQSQTDIPVPIFEPLLTEVQQAELLLERLRSLGKVMK
jgi:hypothetical protein